MVQIEFTRATIGEVTSPPRRSIATSLEACLGMLVEIPAAVLVVAEIVILFAGVIWRYVLREPLIWSDELASILFLWLAMLGAAVALAAPSTSGTSGTSASLTLPDMPLHDPWIVADKASRTYWLFTSNRSAVSGVAGEQGDVHTAAGVAGPTQGHVDQLVLEIVRKTRHGGFLRRSPPCGLIRLLMPPKTIWHCQIF